MVVYIIFKAILLDNWIYIKLLILTSRTTFSFDMGHLLTFIFLKQNIYKCN